MKEYHKIQTVYKRNLLGNKKLIEGEWSTPEFECLANAKWVFTEKVDGTNVRIIFDGNNITLGGRTDTAQLPVKLLNKLTEKSEVMLEKMLSIFDSPVCLYGEGYGDKIQKIGGNYRADQDFVLFDVKIGGLWLERHNVEDIASKLELDVVPVIGEGTLYDAVKWARVGIKSQWGDFDAEGIVARPKAELLTRMGGRLITKIKSIDFC